MRKKTIAILGVDGSGKSTAINNLSKKYGERCTITYMGYTRFEDTSIEELKGKRFVGPLYIYRIYRCFWRRYLNATRTDKVALFDRYVHEIFINASGKYKYINILLYKYLFPKPKKMVYLYCSVEESLKRKKDIINADAFRNMKKRFDLFFLKRKGVLCLDTELLSEKEITERISQFIDNELDYE